MTRGRFIAWLSLLGAICSAQFGCARPHVAGSSADLPSVTPGTTRPTGLTPAQVKSILVAPLSGSTEYYMGDHLSMNLRLLLTAGGTYSVTWHGCEGLDGAAVGKWQLVDDRIVLEPVDAQGSLKKYPLRILHIRMLDGTPEQPGFPAFALVPSRDLPTFMKEGVRDFTCFRPYHLTDTHLRLIAD